MLLEGFLVGSLGIWDPERLPPNQTGDCIYASTVQEGPGFESQLDPRFFLWIFLSLTLILAKKLCVRDTISGSYSVWAAHCRRGGRGCHNLQQHLNIKPQSSLR